MSTRRRPPPRCPSIRKHNRETRSVMSEAWRTRVRSRFDSGAWPERPRSEGPGAGKMIRKLAVVAVVVTGVVMLTAGAAFAHVEIAREGEITAQGVVNATLSVPNESDTNTTKTIELVFPASPKLSSATAEDANGFTATVNKDAAGDVTSITWTGGEITGNEDVKFPMTVGDFPADTE